MMIKAVVCIGLVIVVSFYLSQDVIGEISACASSFAGDV